MSHLAASNAAMSDRWLAMRNARTDAVVVARLRVADRMLTRLRGLLGRPEPAPGEGLWIVPCSGVHTFGMRYPIDVVFLDRSGRIVSVHHALVPSRMVPWVRHAHSALELRRGTIAGCDLRDGDVLVVEPGAEAPR
jgi:uncharacterized protein